MFLLVSFCCMSDMSDLTLNAPPMGYVASDILFALVTSFRILMTAI